MSTYNSADEAFDAAKKSFRDHLNDQKIYNKILGTAATIDDVYGLAAQLQEDAASTSRLRYLKRLQPFLEALAGYQGTIEVFVQVKPEILALLWGPVRHLLKLSSELAMALDALAQATLKIAQALPQFSDMANELPKEARVQAALALFYGDILDFYSVMLRIFHSPRWKLVWPMLWNQNKKKVDVVVKNITEHVGLMRNEAGIAEIKAANEARARSIAHFELGQGFQESQKFEGLRTWLNPARYDERLDWLRNRIHEGSPKWLFQAKEFQEWLDMSNKEATWLWLQGNPGSGKTYLAAAAVDKAAKRHQTLFVFATYNHHNSTTALSITQSLVFQAAEDSSTTQTMVVEFSEHDFTSDGGKVLELLKALLDVSEGTYIIIDGLDEMDESERRILLQRLDDLVSASDQLKILICSRPEDDISRELEMKSKKLRVDQRNMASIQAFVDYKTHEWMATQGFDQSTESEVSSMLSPVAARANGMFLYARIVLDNLLELNSIEQIRRELKALPTELDDAYQRAFDRINNNPRIREKARKILAWIGYAPAPMTTLEMEQALLLSTPPDEHIPSIVGSTNFIKLCGPIVEIVDDHPQFVHFTVQQYIFSNKIKGFIDVAFANETLALTSISYLCSSVLDSDYAESTAYIKDNILAGNYRLLAFVTWYWAGLTLMAARNMLIRSDDSKLHTLNRLMSRAALYAGNYEFGPEEASFQPEFEDSSLECLSPEGRDVLRGAYRFRMDERQPEWTRTNADTWINLDPLATSKILVKFREVFESLLCANVGHDDSKPCSSECHSAALRRHYGPRFYKCSYFFCPYSRHGFESSRDRANHEQSHGQPWKCPSTSCQFSVIGFSTRKRMDIHINRFHQDESDPMVILDAEKLAACDFETLQDDEVQPLLFNLARSGHVDALQRLLNSSSGSKVRPGFRTAARASAAKHGSMAITQLLTGESETYLPTIIVTHAIESEDPEFVKWALTKADPLDMGTGKFNKLMLGTPSDEIYSIWETFLIRDPLDARSLLKARVFHDVKDNPLAEERLARIWKLLWPEIASDYVRGDQALIALANSTTSVRLGTALLRLGVDVNYRGMKGTGRSPLALAAKKTTKEAAKFMKLLIENGASATVPIVKPGGMPGLYTIGVEAGARGIQQWLGVTWEELVEANKDAWKKSALARSRARDNQS